MPQGTFNITRLIRELGLKNIVEMPVRQNVQPVLPLNSMHGHTPLHQAPLAMYGGLASAGAAAFAVVQIQALDPGGCVLVYARLEPDNGGLSFNISTTSVVWGTGPLAMTGQQFEREPVRSIVQWGTTAAALSSSVARFGTLPPFPLGQQIHVRPGSYLQIGCLTANTAFRVGIVLQGIQASEAEPS